MIGIFSTKKFVLKALVITFLISMTISTTTPAQVSWETLIVQRDFIVLRDFGWYYETLRIRRFEL